jgi:hypothetical protein
LTPAQYGNYLQQLRFVFFVKHLPIVSHLSNGLGHVV